MDDMATEKAILDKCESPIETHLTCCLTMLLLDSADIVTIVPQYQLDRYRYDFAITRTIDGELLLLIECDGKDFHSTPEQVENDRRKDVVARDAGIKLARFSGAEIFRDPLHCANVVVHMTAAALVQREMAA